MKSLKEKWLSIVQSTVEKGENEIGGSSIITPSISENRVCWVMEWVAELWENSAIRSKYDHSLGLLEVNSCKCTFPIPG